MATNKSNKKTLENMTRIFFGPKFGSLYRSGEDTKGVIKSHILNKNRQYKSTEGHEDKQWSP